MQQRFLLQLSQDTLQEDAKRLGVTALTLKHITIDVIAQIQKSPTPYLELNYRIELPTPLSKYIEWSDWQADKVGFSDFLWEKTCLECFIQQNHQSGYVEINAAPCGKFAVYNFLNYRTPSGLPPEPLFISNGNRAVINWQNFSQDDLSDNFRRQFTIDLKQLPNFQENLPNFGIGKLHPCVILNFEAAQLYFAPKHAIPADFHDASYWQDFKPKS
ncbi:MULTISPECIES: hypothetical protein [Psychrobacter]|uniref:hypothetical protein n=1 Tax=Psychrobacter TaxID=497 RepID=UPI00146BC7F9|nr:MULTISPECIES: hypothetical protein [Psychrobacter]